MFYTIGDNFYIDGIVNFLPNAGTTIRSPIENLLARQVFVNNLLPIRD
ncbi:hypothetical protein [Halobacillus dabanensis]|nr:hypothetical protein [Halobacillus dabanensis]